MKISPADLYRNSLTDLKIWNPINLENGILEEGVDYFLNLLDVKKYWKENLKIKDSEMIRKEIEKVMRCEIGLLEGTEEIEMDFSQNVPENMSPNLTENVLEITDDVLDNNFQAETLPIAKKKKKTISNFSGPTSQSSKLYFYLSFLIICSFVIIYLH